jgi:hypothetical protein
VTKLPAKTKEAFVTPQRIVAKKAAKMTKTVLLQPVVYRENALPPSRKVKTVKVAKVLFVRRGCCV